MRSKFWCLEIFQCLKGLSVGSNIKKNLKYAWFGKKVCLLEATSYVRKLLKIGRIFSEYSILLLRRPTLRKGVGKIFSEASQKGLRYVTAKMVRKLIPSIKSTKSDWNNINRLKVMEKALGA